MYLGPAGAEIRKATSGAICSPALDAAGYHFSQQGASITRESICGTAENSAININQFAFVTESLGSKIIFDIMRDAQYDQRETIIDEMIAGTEVYMLANQLALLSLSDLSPLPRRKLAPLAEGDRPRLIAMSEINDFLSYELIPFLEHLDKRTFARGHVANHLAHIDGRKALIEKLGFDMVDVRLEFADKLVGIVNGFVDPKDAHTGHAKEPLIIELMLCGAETGQPRQDTCLASHNRQKK